MGHRGPPRTAAETASTPAQAARFCPRDAGCESHRPEGVPRAGAEPVRAKQDEVAVGGTGCRWPRGRAQRGGSAHGGGVGVGRAARGRCGRGGPPPWVRLLPVHRGESTASPESPLRVRAPPPREARTTRPTRTPLGTQELGSHQRPRCQTRPFHREPNRMPTSRCRSTVEGAPETSSKFWNQPPVPRKSGTAWGRGQGLLVPSP